jgi:hypothetical protein
MEQMIWTAASAAAAGVAAMVFSFAVLGGFIVGLVGAIMIGWFAVVAALTRFPQILATFAKKAHTESEEAGGDGGGTGNAGARRRGGGGGGEAADPRPYTTHPPGYDLDAILEAKQAAERGEQPAATSGEGAK